jgi:hypothetical protein
MTRQFLASATAFALLAVGAGRTAAGPTAGAVFTFDNFPVGTATPFSDTQGGVTAQFLPAFGSGFVLVPVSSTGFGPPLMGNLLTNGGPMGESHTDLAVIFSKTVFAVSVDFGLFPSDEPNRNELDLTAYSGVPPILGGNGTVVGGASAFAEPTVGTISFHSAPFDAIIISSGNAPFFWVDNVALDSAAAIPEPAGLTLAALGLGALAVRAWRRNAVT